MEDKETAEQQAKERQEAVRVWFQQIQEILIREFPEYGVEGQVAEHPTLGYLFAFKLDREQKTYACGFLLTELINNFQTNSDPVLWLSSFFVDLIKSPESRPMPRPPESEEEAKQLIDEKVVPLCAANIREEFADEQVMVDLDLHPEYGPVLESGFPAIKEGNNTCAMPLGYLMTLYLLNRDPSEPVIQALYKIQEAHAVSRQS